MFAVAGRSVSCRAICFRRSQVSPCARTKNLELQKKRGALEVLFWPFLAAQAGFLAPQMCVFREGGRAECFFSGVRFSFPLFGWRFVSTPSRSSFGFFGVRKLEALPAATQHFQTTNSSVFFSGVESRTKAVSSNLGRVIVSEVKMLYIASSVFVGPAVLFKRVGSHLLLVRARIAWSRWCFVRCSFFGRGGRELAPCLRHGQFRTLSRRYLALCRFAVTLRVGRRFFGCLPLGFAFRVAQFTCLRCVAGLFFGNGCFWMHARESDVVAPTLNL